MQDSSFWIQTSHYFENDCQQENTFTAQPIDLTHFQNPPEDAIHFMPHTSSFPTQRNVKKRKRVTPFQLDVLNKVFERQPYPSVQVRQCLADDLNMCSTSVKKWFQNKRSKINKELFRMEEKRQATRNQLDKERLFNFHLHRKERTEPLPSFHQLVQDNTGVFFGVDSVKTLQDPNPLTKGVLYKKSLLADLLPLLGLDRFGVINKGGQLEHQEIRDTFTELLMNDDDLCESYLKTGLEEKGTLMHLLNPLPNQSFLECYEQASDNDAISSELANSSCSSSSSHSNFSDERVSLDSFEDKWQASFEEETRAASFEKPRVWRFEYTFKEVQ